MVALVFQKTPDVTFLYEVEPIYTTSFPFPWGTGIQIGEALVHTVQPVGTHGCDPNDPGSNPGRGVSNRSSKRFCGQNDPFSTGFRLKKRRFKKSETDTQLRVSAWVPRAQRRSVRFPNLIRNTLYSEVRHGWGEGVSTKSDFVPPSCWFTRKNDN